LEIEITPDILRVSTIRGSEESMQIGVYDRTYELPPGSGREFSLKDRQGK
jgi:hypothetical protein